MKYLVVLGILSWLWPFHHHPKPKTAPAPQEENNFCDPDDHDDYKPLPCPPIDDCQSPWDTNMQRCTELI